MKYDHELHQKSRASRLDHPEYLINVPEEPLDAQSPIQRWILDLLMCHCWLERIRLASCISHFPYFGFDSVLSLTALHSTRPPEPPSYMLTLTRCATDVASQRARPAVKRMLSVILSNAYRHPAVKMTVQDPPMATPPVNFRRASSNMDCSERYLLLPST